MLEARMGIELIYTAFQAAARSLCYRNVYVSLRQQLCAQLGRQVPLVTELE